MNEHEAQRIASAINRLRPDWPERQLLTLIRERLGDRPRRDVAVALTWVACETTTASPYRVLETGPWWLAVAVDGDTTGRRDPYNAATHCGICSRSEADCRRNPHADHNYESGIDTIRNARRNQGDT
jgi:hypothetical protein